MQMVYIVAKLF